MHRARGILMISELLFLTWLVSVTGIYYDLSWLQNPPAKNNILRQPHELDHSRLSDTSYLSEDAFDDEVLKDVEDETEERLNRNDRSLLPEYRNLCETVTRKVELKNDPTYEFQPPHYYEVFCKSYSLMDDEPQKSVIPSKQKCAHPSFHCVQRSRTLFMVRRRWDGDCWEPITKVVASGCDCMWPVSTLGDVSIHY